jgi:hypothetical protein
MITSRQLGRFAAALLAAGTIAATLPTGAAADDTVTVTAYPTTGYNCYCGSSAPFVAESTGADSRPHRMYVY